ncbi:hypothetical protein SAMN05444166_0299 [Singulisphaera sp. GP187]|uniref:hypothetical protein n=1 Tax=Singulisphaera sp. GP187 TaxID=1882752 RepID=UPI00092B3B1A|nr:hypothetical protein [Singulisphaera sp. GP187]SIN70848.1 hypothetical protein SAMN05444166_0299 [Singulisphaera sp. GP187]
MASIKTAIETAVERAIRFLGPVANAVHGEISKQETVRALTKAVIVGAVTRASMAATIQRQEVLTDVVVPLAAAVFTGLLDALSRLQQGEPKPVTPRNDEMPQFPLPEPSSQHHP